MQIKLDTNIQFLKGVGPKMSVKLEKLGVETVRDLIFYFPRGYNDYTQITKIRDLVSMEYEARSMEGKTIRAKIVNIKNKRTSRRRFTITEAVVADETGSIKVVWFNQPYLEKMLKAGREIILNGKVRRSSYSSELQLESPNRAEKSKIVPVYPETLGISSYYISKLQKAVSSQLGDVREYIPDVILKNNQLLPIQEAIKQLHEPENSEKLEKARQRIAFDELFLFSLQKQLLKKDILIRSSPKS
jgi:ATP-dependent DNA helicase RecG